MSNEPVLVATLPPGEYVVGDPCYSIPDDKWHAWLRAADYTNPSREHVLVAEVNGHLCVGVSTFYGDGSYPDNMGNLHPVDAGLLGLVPLAIAEKNSMGDDRVIMTFDEPIECRYNGGLVTLGSVEIETRDVPDDDYDLCCNCGGEEREYGSDYCEGCEPTTCSNGCGEEVDDRGSLCDDCESEDDDEDDD